MAVLKFSSVGLWDELRWELRYIGIGLKRSGNMSMGVAAIATPAQR
jgi:hypothetical protein